MHLARFVQRELDDYQQWDRGFPPQSQRPQSVLVVTDRSMDLMAPLLHEFTYQAMVHDLLPIQEQPNGKATFHMTINENTPEAEEKDMELAEKDPVWVGNRHKHMKDTIDRLMSDFQKFLDQNPNAAASRRAPGQSNLNDIRDMLAGLPQFQEMKNAYSLHLTMAQEAMNIFQKYKLADLASVEQTLATGLDEDGKKPKNILDQIVRLLDDPDVAPADRLRLIAIYALYRDGMISQDLHRLLWHASLSTARGRPDQAVIENMELLGARPLKQLKEQRQAPPSLFPAPPKQAIADDEYALSRFEPAVKRMLELLVSGELDQTLFPYVVPPDDASASQQLHTQGSLRSAAPRWAQANRRQAENRQRIIVFVAGGATFSEARACYEISEKHNRDVYLATSHLVSPGKYIADLRDLQTDRRRLNLPLDRPPPKPPAHIYEKPQPKPMMPPQMPTMQTRPGPPGLQQVPPPGQPVPPTAAMASMSLGGGAGDQRPGTGDSGDGKKKDKDKKKKLFGFKK